MPEQGEPSSLLHAASRGSAAGLLSPSGAVPRAWQRRQAYTGRPRRLALRMFIKLRRVCQRVNHPISERFRCQSASIGPTAGSPPAEGGRGAAGPSLRGPDGGARGLQPLRSAECTGAAWACQYRSARVPAFLGRKLRLSRPSPSVILVPRHGTHAPPSFSCLDTGTHAPAAPSTRQPPLPRSSPRRYPGPQRPPMRRPRPPGVPAPAPPSFSCPDTGIHAPASPGTRPNGSLWLKMSHFGKLSATPHS